MLTNLNQNGTLYAPKAKQAEGKASSKEATKELKKVTLKEVLQQAIKIENIKAEDVPDSVIKTFHKQHLQLVKNFTTLQPTKEVRKLTFTDKTMDKEIVLPDDWYYAQVKYQLSENTNATITGAGSVHEAKEAAKAVDLEGIFNVVSYNFEVLDKSDDPVVRRAAFDKVADKYLEEYTKAVQHMNSCFITTSVKVKDDGWKNALATPASNQLGVNAFLRDNLQRLKAYRSENFALHDYNYNLDFTSEKANIDINADFMALKSFNFNSKLFLGCKNDIVSLMFFVKKADFTPDAKLTEQINAWKF